MCTNNVGETSFDSGLAHCSLLVKYVVLSKPNSKIDHSVLSKNLAVSKGTDLTFTISIVIELSFGHYSPKGVTHQPKFSCFAQMV